MPVEPPPSKFRFPSPEVAGDDDLVVVGGDLEAGTVLAAYRRGMFPMHLSEGPLGWWSPARRGVLPLEGMRVTRSLSKSYRRFTYTIDVDPAAVIAGCADQARPNGWITAEISDAYLALHDLGWVHSVEAWGQAGELAGGLYGVAIGGLFAGESMFARQRDASKCALKFLVDRLMEGGAVLLDTQWATPHLISLGVVEIDRVQYGRRLEIALALPGPWGL
ncbi:MAG: leucyl/phenylalanyl-tRNA--protein transferase [Acidimicrobiia bacterium]|nr:leucyl/phenylalanyl-tRNA--protein transferase [Acidimicrobiia bacterium]